MTFGGEWGYEESTFRVGGEWGYAYSSSNFTKTIHLKLQDLIFYFSASCRLIFFVVNLGTKNP
jgi:hypothetical protein